jgi:hypothetical protein
MPSNARPAYISLIFILLAYTLYNWNGWAFTSSWIFQERDLNRAADLLRGHMIAYGPETTGGGHLFGPLYYFLLAIPALFGMPWKGGWYLMQLFTAGGGILLWLFLRSRIGLLTANFALVFYLFSDWVRHVNRHFYNASFVAPFIVVATILLVRTFSDEKSNGRSWFLFLLAVGLGCQLQASIFLLLLVGITLQIAAPQMGLSRLDRRVFFLGFFGLLIPLLPFLLWKLSTLPFSDVSPDGTTFDALKAMSVIVQQSHEGIQSLGLVFLGYVFLHTPCVSIALALTTLLSASVAPAISDQQKKMIRILLLQVLMMFPLIIYHTFASNAYRYIGPYVVGVAVLAAILLGIAATHSGRRFTALGGWLVLFCTFIFYFSGAQTKLVWDLTSENPEDLGTKPGTNQVLYAISEKIFEQTHWSYAEARRRLFFVNMHVEQGFAYPYLAATLSPRETYTLGAPDGYIAATDGPSDCEPETPSACRKWILRQEIPDELKRWIAHGQIQLQNPIALRGEIKRAFLIPYKNTNLEKAPPFFQNIGYGYAKYPNSRKIEDHGENYGAEKDSNGSYVFHWNDCPEHEQGCSTGMIVDVQPHRIHVQILGQSLSHASEWFSARWTEEWRQPFIKLECHGRSEKILLAESIGRSPEYTKKARGNIVIRSNSILAPFERIFARDCPGGFSKITAGRAGSTVVDTNFLEPLHITAPVLSVESRAL